MEKAKDNALHFTARLFDCTKKAQDGSIISREVMEEYLKSPKHKENMDKHLCTGGITHRSRYGGSVGYNIEGIGPDDGILIDENMCFYVTNIYFKDGDNFCYADFTVLDPSKFSGKQRDNIQNLVGMLQSGMYLPMSIVILAEWGTDERCLKIKNLLGADMTLNPSFQGAGVVKIFSERAKNRMKGDARVFSFSSRIEYDGCRANTVTEDLNKLRAYAVDYQLQDAAFIGKYLSNKSELNTPSRIKSFCDADLRRRAAEDHYEGVSTFSYYDSIRDRVIATKMPAFQRLRRVMNAYKDFYKGRKAQLSSSEFIYMVEGEIAQILLPLMDKIKGGSGKILKVKLGAFAYGNLAEVLDAYVDEHRKTLLVKDRLNFMPKDVYQRDIKALNGVYNSVLGYITDGELNVGDADRNIYI